MIQVNNSWTKLKIQLDVKEHVVRKVLFEKSSKKIEMINFFISKLDGCKLFINKHYNESVFYIKNGEIIMEKDKKSKIFFINQDFWEEIKNKYSLNDTEVYLFTKDNIETFFKVKVFKTCFKKHFIL